MAASCSCVLRGVLFVLFVPFVLFVLFVADCFVLFVACGW
jgi:hypothetical protein